MRHLAITIADDLPTGHNSELTDNDAGETIPIGYDGSDEQTNTDVSEPTMSNKIKRVTAPTTITKPISTLFKSRRLSQLAPEFVPAYTPTRGQLLNDNIALIGSLVQSQQSDSELRGDIEPELLSSLETICFFSDLTEGSNDNDIAEQISGLSR
jgi:hypothetical protein